MKRILISRTDGIGDVVLTLPVAGVIRQHLPQAEILFLGRAYTLPVIEACVHIDRALNWDEIRLLPYPEQKTLFRSLEVDAILHVFPSWPIAMLADMAGIPVRIGTAHRLVSWMLCNRWVWFSRRRSPLHEAQLNLKLLKPLGIDILLPRENIPDYYGLPKSQQPKAKSQQPTANSQQPTANPPPFKLILHPKSRGSAREWGLDNFSRLIELLPAAGFDIYVTGTAREGLLMKDFLARHQGRITDMTGKLSLSELLAFIGECDGIVAASTGPLHLAAALGKTAIGLYAPMRPIDPGRWAPLGSRAISLVRDIPCNDCRKSGDCHCIREITPGEVISQLI